MYLVLNHILGRWVFGMINTILKHSGLFREGGLLERGDGTNSG